MSDGVPCMWMRGGTSKGGYFLASDLPEDRDAFLLERKSERPGADVDYLFLQVFVEQPIVTDAQNCGNILAGVAPFAIERGLVAASEGATKVRIFMENTKQLAIATVQTPGGRVTYEGSALIDGVPLPSAPVEIAFQDTAGSSCGALLPSGRTLDEIEGVACTLVDNGMPCVVLRAGDLGIRGDEEPAALEANEPLRARLEAIRQKAGPLMNLGDVTEKSVPKMTLVSPPLAGGAISTRTFIPHRCHSTIGVLGAVSVATACLLPEGPARELAVLPGGSRPEIVIEHPSGSLTVVAALEQGKVVEAAILRTARKLFDGLVFRR
jgi:4-oxalomesaconate tautomerase